MKKNLNSCILFHVKKNLKHSISVFLLMTFFFVLQSFTDVNDCKVTVNVKNASIEEILWKIKEQTKLEFVYVTEDLKPYKGISLNVTDKPLKSVLDGLFKNTNLKYSVSNDVIVIARKTSNVHSTPSEGTETTQYIVGKVKDSQGIPLPGAYVVVKGTNDYYYTDVDGNFKIESSKVNPQSLLQVSYIGMRPQELPVGNSSKLNIILADMSEQIEEVMVVAYGVVRKEAYTGSAQVIKGDQIMGEASPLTAEKALQGYVAGVRVTQTDGQPGAKATIQIRGIGSINGNLEPLYVIDGVPMVSGDMSQLISSNVMTALNPDDIESMTVLKDAAATSLYGSDRKSTRLNSSH